MEIIGGGCSCPNRPHCGHGDINAFAMRAKATRKRKEETPKDKKKNRKAFMTGLTGQPKK